MCVLLEFQRFWNCGRCTTVDEIVVMHCCTRLALDNACIMPFRGSCARIRTRKPACGSCWDVARVAIASDRHLSSRILAQCQVGGADQAGVLPGGGGDDARVATVCAALQEPLVVVSRRLQQDVADRHYAKACTARDAGKSRTAAEELERCIGLLLDADRLLALHPDYRIEEWVEYAGEAAPTDSLKRQYAANARRLITTWGGFQEDYAARFWSGMIRDYYVPRLRIRFSDHSEQLDAWEEQWIQSPEVSEVEPYEDPLAAARELVAAAE